MPFVIDDLAIAAMVASAALAAKSQADAAKRTQQAATEARRRQMSASNAATDVAMKQVQEFDPTARQDKQQVIADDLTAQYDKAAQATPLTAQGVQVGQTIEGGSPDYLVTKAKEQAKTTASLRALAGLMGRIGSAGELQRGEAVGIGDAAGSIGRIQTGANNTGGIDEIGIQAAGQPSLGMTLASSALGAYGLGKMATAGLTKPAAASGLTGGWL